MLFLTNLLWILLGIFTVKCAETNTPAKCLTPNNQHGECIIISLCSPLFSIAFDHTTNSSTSKDYLKKSYCGMEAIMFPKVCCPIGLSRSLSLSPGGEDIDTRDLLPDPGSPRQCGIYSSDKVFHRPGEADLDQYPWDVLIEYENREERAILCGGVLINHRYVLTAAHCTKAKKNWRMINVRLGEYNTETNPDCRMFYDGEYCLETPLTIPITEIVPHEEYNPQDPNQYHDIALIRLKHKVSFKRFFPICLPTELISEDYNGELAPMSGWGKTGNHSKNYIKHVGNAMVYKSSDCPKKQFPHVLKEGQLCGIGRNNTEERDFYPGDVGGYILGKPTRRSHGLSVLGIFSRSTSDCCQMVNYPRVYTNVAYYSNWIYTKIKP